MNKYFKNDIVEVLNLHQKNDYKKQMLPIGMRYKISHITYAFNNSPPVDLLFGFGYDFYLLPNNVRLYKRPLINWIKYFFYILKTKNHE